MKKKILLASLTILLIFCAIGLTACGGVEFKVNFVVDGAVYATIDTNGQEIIKMPENPSKENYTFDGWYWDKDTWQTPFTANSLLDAPLSSDMNVYCKWKANVVNVESITLDKTEITLHENDVEYLTATILPDNASDTSVRWESSNSTIATVVGGKVTALRVGSATISAITNDGGKIATCNVYVEPILVESVNLNYTSLSLLNGESKTLTVTVLPNNATEKGVNWSSSNSSIATVENGVIKAVGYGSATITVTTIDGNETASCIVEVVADKITFNTLLVEDETVYGKVSNSTATFSFIKEIVEHGNATYKVYKEITCETEIYSKSISLKPGDNTVYILQTVGRDIKLYTITVRRRPMYEVVFNTNGGTAVSSQTVEEDSFATLPIAPTRLGYTFDKWNYNFNTPITSDTTITGSWNANKNTPYKVEYYLENLEDENYTLTETAIKTGTTDTIANAEIKTFTHFTHKSSSTDSGNIAPNGATVLKVYYTRDKYTVTFNGNGGTLVSGNASQTVKYGGSVVAPTFAKTGYTFTDFDKSLTNVCENFTITAQWKINQYTLTIVYNNGEKDKEITQDYNSAIEIIVNPIKVGYTFNGWSESIPTNMPSKNLTITAKWLAIFNLSGGQIKGLTTHGKTLTQLYIPNAIDGVNITSISNYAFEDCTALTSVVIGNSVESIGEWAFYNCNSLTSIAIGSGVTSIGRYAFYDCTAEIIWGDNPAITEIGEHAFYSYGGTSVEIPNSVTSIGYEAFIYCKNLTKVNYTGTIDEWAQIVFYDYNSNPLVYAENLYINNQLITKVIITTATKISLYAFSNCSSLISVVIGGSVTSIGERAFSGCTSLKRVEIGNSVTIIGKGALGGCSSLESITLPFVGASATATDYASVFGYIFGYTKFSSSDTTWQYYYHYYIPKSLKTVIITGGSEISPYAFEGCNSLTSIEIPDSIISIGGQAFYGCYSLTSIEIPDSIISIGAYAFIYCNNLTRVYYKGSADDWSKILIYSNNSSLTLATRYYYSEIEPSLNAGQTAYNGNYWHYDENGEIVIWEK